VTAAGDLIGGRYRVERQDRVLGGLRRLVASDARLPRTVLVWVSEASGAEEDALLAIARAAGRSHATSFLQVLDVAYEDEGVAVVLESPGESLARLGRTSLNAAAAAALLDAVDRAEGDGLRLARADARDVFVVDGEVLADPVALFLPPLRAEAAATVDHLVTLLIEHAADARALAAALNGGAPAPGTAATREAAARAAASAAAPYVDEEPTVVFTPRAATAVADRVAPAPAAAAPTSPAPVAPRGARGAPLPPVDDAPTAGAEVVEMDEIAREPAAPRRGALPWRVFIPLYGALAVVVAGVLVFALQSPSTNPPPTPTASAGDPAGPPAVAPAAGQVTVGLAATEDSGVRVTVDGIVQFDGILRAGQRQSWDGRQRIDVWTDKGKTLLLAVNGKDLGPYSPAMGHADWNRIDFSFWPGFGQ